MKITKNMLEGVKKGNSYSINPSDIVVDAEMNPRQEYGNGDDWDSFKKSIMDLGIQQNLKVYFDETNNKYHLAHGFRRMKAVQELAQEGHVIELIPVDIVENDKEAAIIGHFVLNSGKALTDPEMAEGLRRLKMYSGVENVSELARKAGISTQKGYTLLNFAENAGSQVKKALANGEIAFSVANSIIHNSGSISEQNKLLKEGKEKAKTEGKEKIRTQHIGMKISDGKVNLETKIGNLLAELDKAEEVDKEAVNMFIAIVKALKSGKTTEEIIPLFNIQVG